MESCSRGASTGVGDEGAVQVVAEHDNGFHGRVAAESNVEGNLRVACQLFDARNACWDFGAS